MTTADGSNGRAFLDAYEQPGTTAVAESPPAPTSAMAWPSEVASPFRPVTELVESAFASSEPELAEAEEPEAEDFDPEDFEAAVRLFEEEFPSGAVLQRTTGPTGRDQEHWDPNGVGLPLLATGPSAHSIKLARNFTVRELVTSGGRTEPVARISPDLVRVLQAMRDRAGKPLAITSGYRSWARNRALYQARGKKPTLSRHCSGQAADIKIAGMNGTDIAKLAIDAAGKDLGVGVGASFAHIDVRGKWTLWTYLGGSAGETAMRTVREYRDRSGGSRPIPPTPGTPSSPTPVRPGAGLGGRLVVDRHPMLRGHKGTAPDLVLRWNAITSTGEIDVVVHLHGFSGRQAAMSLVGDKEPISGLDFADPAGSGSPGRTRPTLALLPRGNFYGGKSGSGYSFPALIVPGAIQALVQDGLARFTAQTGIQARPGRLILTAHSGGGAPLMRILAHTDPDEVHVFDALYGSADALIRWAERRVARELLAASPVPPALRVLYRPGTARHPGTQPHSEAVARALCRLLAAPGAARLAPTFRVDRTSVGHNEMPKRFGWALLADAGRDLAGVTRRDCAGRAKGQSGEAAFETTSFEAEEDELEPGMEADVPETEAYGAEAPVSPSMEQLEPEVEAMAWLTQEDLEPALEDEGLEPEAEEFQGAELDPEPRAWLEEGAEPVGEELEPPGYAPADAVGFEAEATSTEEDEAGPPPPGYEVLDQLVQLETGAGTSLTDRVRGVAAFAFGGTLRRGSKGQGVAALQRALKSLGHDLDVDGDFGPNTERAVRAFQASAGIGADGIVGPQTKSAIATALAGRAGPAPTGTALCDAIARIAEEEYRRWHPSSGPIRETHAAATPILQRYYREGVGAEISAANLQSTTWQASHPWSAVFISAVMRSAGAGTGFSYSRAHQGYIRAARRNRLNGNQASPFWAYRPTEVAPQVGDLVCASRANSGATYDNIGDAQIRATHCDIVTRVSPGSLRVIGGNVRQNVDTKTIRTQPDGRLALDGNQARFFAVVRCRGATPNVP